MHMCPIIHPTNFKSFLLFTLDRYHKITLCAYRALNIVRNTIKVNRKKLPFMVQKVMKMLHHRMTCFGTHCLCNFRTGLLNLILELHNCRRSYSVMLEFQSLVLQRGHTQWTSIYFYTGPVTVSLKNQRLRSPLEVSSHHTITSFCAFGTLNFI